MRATRAVAWSVSLILWAASSQAEPGGRVRLTFEWAPETTGATRRPSRAVLRAESSTMSERAVEASLEKEVEIPGSMEIDLAPERVWRLSVVAPGAWAPVVELPIGDRPPVRFSLIPAAKVGGRVQVPAQERAPASLEARFRSSPKARPEVPAVVAICPVREGHWECEVPATTLDLRLQAEGFIPRYLWDVAVVPGQTADLGSFELVRGGSLIGWAELGDPPAQRDAKPEIELAPSLMGGNAAWAASDRMRQRALTAHVNERGFFQLTGIAPGEYVVTARLEGFSPASAPPVTLSAAMETELREPLLLRRPTALEIRLHPETDPYGQPWHLDLASGGTSSPPRRLESAGRGVADATGVWRKEGLADGKYLLFVNDFTGSRWRADWIEVEPGMPPRDLDLNLVRVEGHVLFGNEPMETTVWLEQKKAGSRIRFDSDEKGRFDGYLPAEGEWAVDLELPRQGAQALDPVEVKRPASSGAARVEIRIPDTHLAVLVTDEAGAPMPDAEVVILSDPERLRREAQVRTDGKGEVVLRGIVPGVVHLYAKKDEASSDWTVRTVAEDRDEGTVSLVLREKIRLAGQVVAAAGPVAGARVIVFSDIIPGARGWVERALSEADGQFQLRLDRSFSGGTLVLVAPGFAGRLVRLNPPASKDERLELTVDPTSGEALVGLGPAGTLQAVLRHTGGQVPLWAFLQEGVARPAESDRFLLERLEPGDYALCPDRWSPPGACSTGTLPANGRLELTLPESRPVADLHGGPR